MNYYDKTASLIPLARQIICDKATEYPFSGVYSKVVTRGTYLCRRCGLALFRAHDQFNSGCGWPSFDDAIEGVIKQQLDNDGMRVEIVCHRCDAHLGHIFTNEQFTIKNRRYCVNAHALDFVDDESVLDTEEAIVAGGCFWGVAYYLQRLFGVVKVEVGYCGGHLDNPTYQDICRGNTGHYEAVRVIFNPAITDYRTVLKYFFETHDPTQSSGQGPDIGQQYQSAVFYHHPQQKNELLEIIRQLQNNGYNVVTRLLPAQPFYRAEAEHQNYYERQRKTPYCHMVVKRFD